MATELSDRERSYVRARLRLYGVQCSAFGERVAALLSAWVDGLHHVPDSQLRKADWANEHWIQLAWYGPLSTFDGDELTRLVVLAHDRCVRVELRPCNGRYVYLGFSPRAGREGSIFERHPTIEDALARVRGGDDG